MIMVDVYSVLRRDLIQLGEPASDSWLHAQVKDDGRRELRSSERLIQEGDQASDAQARVKR